MLAEVGMEIRGPEMRRRLLDHGLPLERDRRRGSCSRATSSRRPSRPRRPRSACTTATGPPHADLGGDRVHFIPGSSGLKVLDHRTGETRLANSTDFVEYVRLGRRPREHPVPRHGLLDQRRHRSRGVRRLAPVHDPDELEEAGRVGRLHRARRPADGRDDGAVPGGPGRPHRPPDVDLHDHRDRQLPVQRGLLPEPDRLRRGGHRGRDRAGHADGPDRAR